MTFFNNPPVGLFLILKNTTSTVLIRGVFGAAKIIVLLLIARTFSPADFGRLSLVLSFTEVFKAIADFGLDTVTLRRYAKNARLTDRLLHNGLTLKLICSTAAYGAAIILFRLIYANEPGFVMLLIVATSIYSTLFVNAFLSFFQANLSVVNVIWSNMISATVYTVLTLFCLYLNYPLLLIAAVIPLSEFINLVLTMRMYRSLRRISFRMDRRIILALLKESLPAGFAGIIVMGYLRLDQLMIGWYLGEKAVGEYAGAFRITEPFLLVFSALSISLYAHFSSQRKRTHEGGYASRLVTLLLSLTGASILVATAVYLSSDYLIRILPDKYQDSLAVMNILCWSIIVKAITPQLSAIISSFGEFRILTIISFAVLLITAGLNGMLIPRYGIQGAALTVIFAEVANAIMQSYCIARLIGARTVSSPA